MHIYYKAESSISTTSYLLSICLIMQLNWAIHHNENVEVEALKVSANFATWNRVCELTNPIRYKIFNVNNVVSNIDVVSFLQNSDIEPCSCRDPPFIDKDHCHVLTGDLRIVKNTKLHKVIFKGATFREKSHQFPWG